MAPQGAIVAKNAVEVKNAADAIKHMQSTVAKGKLSVEDQSLMQGFVLEALRAYMTLRRFE